MTTIECKNLSFKYEQDYVLSNIDFKLKTNSLYVLKGDNGSGKTTLCKILTGLYDNYEGEIYLENRDIKRIIIAMLTKEQKKIIDLYSQGYTQREIAKTLKVSQSNISQRIESIKSELKKSLIEIIPYVVEK